MSYTLLYAQCLQRGLNPAPHFHHAKSFTVLNTSAQDWPPIIAQTAYKRRAGCRWTQVEWPRLVHRLERTPASGISNYISASQLDAGTQPRSYQKYNRNNCKRSNPSRQRASTLQSTSTSWSAYQSILAVDTLGTHIGVRSDYFSSALLNPGIVRNIRRKGDPMKL